MPEPIDQPKYHPISKKTVEKDPRQPSQFFSTTDFDIQSQIQAALANLSFSTPKADHDVHIKEDLDDDEPNNSFLNDFKVFEKPDIFNEDHYDNDHHLDDVDQFHENHNDIDEKEDFFLKDLDRQLERVLQQTTTNREYSRQQRNISFKSEEGEVERLREQLEKLRREQREQAAKLRKYEQQLSKESKNVTAERPTIEQIVQSVIAEAEQMATSLQLEINQTRQQRAAIETNNAKLLNVFK